MIAGETNGVRRAQSGGDGTEPRKPFRRAASGRRKKRRDGPPLPLAKILDRTYSVAGGDLRSLVRTFSWWDRSFPPRITKNARPVRFKGGTLVIHTRSAAWAQELSFHEQELLVSIRGQVKTVRRLRIQVGPMTVPPQGPDPLPPKTVPLPTAKLPGDVARALARVGDDELRAALTRAACTSLALMRNKP